MNHGKQLSLDHMVPEEESISAFTIAWWWSVAKQHLATVLSFNEWWPSTAELIVWGRRSVQADLQQPVCWHSCSVSQEDNGGQMYDIYCHILIHLF
jgi:hypothetical protein